jgi:hypothetical protein
VKDDIEDVERLRPCILCEGEREDGRDCIGDAGGEISVKEEREEQGEGVEFNGGVAWSMCTVGTTMEPALVSSSKK